MSSHIQLIEDGRLIGLDGGPWAAAPVNAWPGFPCEVHRHMGRGEVARRHNPHPLVFLRYGARGRSRIVSGQRTYDLDVAPSQVDIFPAAFRMDHGWWDCTPGDLVSIELNPAALGALLVHGDAPQALRTSLSCADRTLAQVIHCIRTEIEDGCPSGRLFADGLSLAVLSRLHAAHADAPSERSTDRLSTRAREQLKAYIDAHLGTDLRIASLAALVGLSAPYFSRVFRRSFDTTPHRYVVQRRLEKSKAMVASDRSLASIAYGLGFSSQAHFTAAFRQRFGTTPGEVRRSARRSTN